MWTSAAAPESYRLAFTTPEPYVAMLATQDEKDKGERIPDLLDEAYVQPQAVGEGVSVVAIARGDLALEVSGNRKEPALAIAKLAASRIR